ncbi:MAG: histidinol dehydrogenase, partial [Flavisolibacter sp.]
MQIIKNPPRNDWKVLLQRPYVDNRSVIESVQQILNAVKEHGDEALKSFTKKFDGNDMEQFHVTEKEFADAKDKLSVELRAAIRQAQQNIEKFHRSQFTPVEIIETMPGVQCWRKSIGIEKVGLYVPGGTAPLFSTVLMLGIPAKLAGCREIILCTPANAQGQIHPAILYSAQSIGINKVYKLGGAQAIAAMAYGTATVEPVYKIFGPGNQYVTAAKQLVQMQGVSIDMPAGPSEVCVMADDSADPSFIAADLLSQAEHGVDSQVLLVSDSEEVVERVEQELTKQLQALPRKDIAEKALTNSKAIVITDMKEAIDLVNDYASEHLIICCRNTDAIAEKII